MFLSHIHNILQAMRGVNIIQMSPLGLHTPCFSLSAFWPLISVLIAVYCLNKLSKWDLGAALIYWYSDKYFKGSLRLYLFHTPKKKKSSKNSTNAMIYPVVDSQLILQYQTWVLSHRESPKTNQKSMDYPCNIEDTKIAKSVMTILSGFTGKDFWWLFSSTSLPV